MSGSYVFLANTSLSLPGARSGGIFRPADEKAIVSVASGALVTTLGSISNCLSTKSSSGLSLSLPLWTDRVLAEDGREEAGRKEAEKGRLADDGRSEVGIPTLGLPNRFICSSAVLRDLTLDLKCELLPIGEAGVFHRFPVAGPPTAVCRRKLSSWFSSMGLSDIFAAGLASSSSAPHPICSSC